jgi:flagellar basal body rod protein FlgC
MKFLALLLICFSTFAHNNKSYDIKIFCQDINIILTKINTSTSNLVNINTTRTAKGGHYKRKLVRNCKNGHCEIYKDQSSPILKYDPNHPDANKDGYVAYPYYSEAEIRVEILRAQNAYEVVWANKPKSIEAKDWVIGEIFSSCYKDYKNFNEQYNFKKFLGR